ncbi:MAG TPA: hypothetical protein VFC46_11905, partial [Humisphaera sp.]|nr:hypothetical protein [Humisphaera sp.]
MHKRGAGAVILVSSLAITLSITTSSRADQSSTDRSPQDQPDNSDFGLKPNLVPPRPAPLIEIGDRFFGPGPLQRGIQLPTGAVWMPNFTVFGTFQSAMQAFHDPLTESGPFAHLYGDKTRGEWTSRLDIYGNLQLSGTERILIGFRPFDDATFSRPALARYTGYQFSPDGTDGWNYKFVAQPTTLFFEGDLGQIFPSLDPNGTKPWDIGFSVGRQPLLYQDGLLLDDDIDAIGITRNTFLPRGGSNAQLTAIYGWDQINRGDGINHGDRILLGFLVNADYRPSTWDLDLFYVDGHGQSPDGLYAGLSAVQRFGFINTT